MSKENIFVDAEKFPLNIVLPPKAGLKLEPSTPLETVIAVINLMELTVHGDDRIKKVEGLPGVVLTHKNSE